MTFAFRAVGDAHGVPVGNTVGDRMSEHASPVSDDGDHDDLPTGGATSAMPTDIALVEGEFGTALALTHKVREEFERRNLKVRRVPASQVAHRNFPLPTVLATFVESEPPVVYEGYGRILLDFLPRFTTG